MTRKEYEQAYIAGFSKTIRVLRRRRASAGDAEEIAQAAWVRGLKHLDQLEDPNRVGSWVGAIAVNLLRDFARSRRIYPLLAGGSEPRVLPSLNLAAIDIARSLDPRQRELVHAIYAEGRSASEVAMTLGVSTNAVYRRLNRLRAHLRVRLA